MTDGQAFLEPYLSRFLSLKRLPGPTLSEEQAIRWLIDETFLAQREMIRTHHREDIVRFIVLAQTLDAHGYDVKWYKHKRLVTATKKGAICPQLTA